MTFGSLFSGIGGLDLGLERAGLTCAWQVEVSPWCRAVLKKHWPEVPKYDDVRTVGKNNLCPVDVICGGFPCQDISNAGKREGIGGSRSGLWKEYARIVGEIRPKAIRTNRASR
jgi:DNA (cytosine-5)-methyltransferase 1